MNFDRYSDGDGDGVVVVVVVGRVVLERCKGNFILNIAIALIRKIFCCGRSGMK